MGDNHFTRELELREIVCQNYYLRIEFLQKELEKAQEACEKAEKKWLDAKAALDKSITSNS